MNAFLTIITRTALAAIFLLVLVGAGMAIVPKFSQLKGMTQQRDDLLRRIGHKNHEIKVLKDKQQRFQTDPEFVEHIARINGRAKPGELIFRFEQDK